MDGKFVRRLACVVVLLAFVIWPAKFPVGQPCWAAQLDQDSADQDVDESQIAEQLETIGESIPSISAKTKLRRNVAHATFCLPQNVLGILYYGVLQATGSVLYTGEMNEMTIVVTGSLRFGASLGRYIFVPARYLTEAAVRHEYGHTMQGYRHGPFYLVLEGGASFVQAAISTVSPAFAAGYFDRWPENEADKLGGV